MASHLRSRSSVASVWMSPKHECEALETCALAHLNEVIENLEYADASIAHAYTHAVFILEAMRHARAARAGLEVVLARNLPLHYDGKSAAAGRDL
jgi:hypothetical protein